MNPILRDFPEQFETERLLIRAPRPGDGAELNRAVRESWAELQAWMPWAQGKVPPQSESEARLREARARFLTREDLWLLLFMKGSNTLVGSSGLHRINWAVPRFEIGYWVRTQFARRGYITEAVNGITAFAVDELGARRMEIRCDSRNLRSAAVARRCGYELEATLRHDDRHPVDGSLRDTLIFVRLAGD
ncbi:MAG: GNAT family N-acetyltransferase [Anaerolineae bacterium]|nr:GNAT family N-acetyltransferase [Anaerolineae bacterium]